MKLSEQYEQLLLSFHERQSKTTLKELSGILFCSERHTKNIIHDLKEIGWIDWSPGRGRGNVSTITFKVELETFIMQRAEQLVSEASIDEAVSFIKSRTLNALQKEQFLDWLLTKVIHSKEMESPGELDHLRFASYRPLPSLDPYYVHRRSENHMMRHIYNRLIRYSETQQDFVPELAHSFKSSEDELTWIFYLRKHVLFHDGQQVSAADICESFQRHSDKRSAYHWMTATISSVKPLNMYTVEFTLTYRNPFFLHLIASLGGSIVKANKPNVPIGTGPFQVVTNNEDKLTLQAFEHYFGYRPLLDKVTMYFFPQVYETSTMEHAGLDKKLNFYQYPNSIKANSTYEMNTIVDKGSKLLTINQNRTIGVDIHLKKAINTMLSRKKMVKELQGNRHVPAYGMFSEYEVEIEHSLERAQEYLDLSDYDHDVLHLYSYIGAGNEKDSEWIQTELSLIGIIVQVHILPLSALHKLDLTQIADFLLGEQLSDEDQTYTYLSAFFGTHSFIQYHLTKAWNENIMKQLLTPRVEDRLAVLRLAEQTLCEEHSLLYLYRLQQSAIYPNDLENIHLNALGWVDYTKLWYRH
ncbi:ABC transporter substrate-binding protein [Alkalihalobacillus pseudalcaliphilus]|uniref:ABC transporter substrate-binding protein n=1 Tax=Alkalihalobacillus pseudalcaliphilus TaxID=79884 RepID=UPI00064DAFC4|nr:ABC transporter substrate-binding protein [Alkalihalobacillus pseudalcaliphilus]KMK75539.1 hypothetical protein AB990_09585 [Alkalihalobacillus pseudalcaliphilus]